MQGLKPHMEEVPQMRKEKRQRSSDSSLNLLPQIRIHSHLLLSPEANTADGREEEHDTITKLALSPPEDKKEMGTYHIAILNPQILFASTQTPFDIPIQLL